MNPITPDELARWQAQGRPFRLLDVRRAAVRDQHGAEIAGAQWRDPAAWLDWKDTIGTERPVVLYCAKGHEIGQGLAATLSALGVEARYLVGGMQGWLAEGRTVQPLARRTRWVTRERPKIDRIACPWLVLRFIDAQAEFLYVPATDVLRMAAETGATPYDIPGVALSHVGERCSFDAFMATYALDDPALRDLADIVRGADTSRLDLTPQSAGLFAISLGLSIAHADDHAMLRHGLVMYDALYAWCRQGRGETHTWPPGPSA